MVTQTLSRYTVIHFTMTNFLLPLLCVFLAVRTVESGSCPDSWHYYDNSCYRTLSSLTDFEFAKDECEYYGGYLAEINSKEENDFLISIYKAPRYARASSLWIGLNDMKREGTYTWINSGNGANYVNWKSGQPDNYVRYEWGLVADSGEDCVTVNLWSGKWEDDNCSFYRAIGCERAADA